MKSKLQQSDTEPRRCHLKSSTLLLLIAAAAAAAHAAAHAHLALALSASMPGKIVTEDLCARQNI